MRADNGLEIFLGDGDKKKNDGLRMRVMKRILWIMITRRARGGIREVRRRGVKGIVELPSRVMLMELRNGARKLEEKEDRKERGQNGRGAAVNHDINDSKYKREEMEGNGKSPLHMLLWTVRVLTTKNV